VACAIEAQRAGLREVSADKGCLCNLLYPYPSHMTFFTTSELLEIGDIPFPSPDTKTTRNEALELLSRICGPLRLDIYQYQLVKM
jgi:thioredoxin reductase (NADPH)